MIDDVTQKNARFVFDVLTSLSPTRRAGTFLCHTVMARYQAVARRQVCRAHTKVKSDLSHADIHARRNSVSSGAQSGYGAGR